MAARSCHARYSTPWLSRSCAWITPHDVCIIGVRALGKKNGQPTEATVEVIDYYDEATGFTAMQRTTGWHLSIVAAMMARGETPIGSIPLELAVPGKAFVHEAKKPGFSISENVKILQTSPNTRTA